MVEIAAAAVAAIGAILAAHESRKASRQTATSNGKTTGQYIEELAFKADALNKQLAEHTVQDSLNFASIETQLANVIGELQSTRSRVDQIEEQV